MSEVASKDAETEEDKAGKEIRERLTRLMGFLAKQSLFNGDNNDWAANCIKTYLDDQTGKMTLNHAFGLVRPRGRPTMTAGEHDEWVVAAWEQVIEKTPLDKDCPDTTPQAAARKRSTAPPRRARTIRSPCRKAGALLCGLSRHAASR
jgi:hypothetical protein